ncbi:DUF6708 domain-containing protein [Citrobacter tructae]|uniref:DUF6708 domain-containing protein n=1 Tax=Citrobacter tructae TaxID=2562449 RepID=UPI003F57B281
MNSKQSGRIKLRHVDPALLREVAAQMQQEHQPTLSPPVKNWMEDLPGNKESQPTAPRLIVVNEINDTWMEIPRYENIMWGGAWISITITIIPFLIFLLIVPHFILGLVKQLSLFSLLALFALLFTIFMSSLLVFNLKMALLVPRSLPIRFNRARQKIYVYEHKRSWNPWARWPTTVQVYDWANIHAEMTRESDRYDQGYRLYGSFCYPGSKDVMERFALSYTVGHPKMLRGMWSHICRYMQGQDVPHRPLIPDRPRTWALWETVRWPAELDRESRTAPQQELQS